jgi:peptidyl-prolyl cis-trans isomerase SurA
MNEFHDGILLFEISGRKVWNRVQEDSVGLQAFYESVKNKYLTKRSMEGKLYTLKVNKNGDKLYAAYSKYSGNPDIDALLKKKFNKKNDTLLIIQDVKWIAGEDKSIDSLEWKSGAHFIKSGSYSSVLHINRINEPVPLPLNEIQGEIVTYYQEYLENEWTGQLKQKYSVKIDNNVLMEVKKSLSNE